MARLENWRIAPDRVKPRAGREASDVVIVGEAFDNSNAAGRLPDGIVHEMCVYAEPVAVEGAIVEQVCGGLRWILGVPASAEYLAVELYKAQVEIDKLKEQLREKPSPPKSRPRGRTPEGYTWDGTARASANGSKGVWLNKGERSMRHECMRLGCVA